MQKESVIGIEFDGINVRIGRIRENVIEKYHSLKISPDASEQFIVDKIILNIKKIFNPLGGEEN